MSAKEGKTKVLIREYLLDGGLFRENINDPKLDFGFQFAFPKGTTPDGRQVGKNFAVVKPKNKDLIQISCGTQISAEHVKKLNSLPGKGKLKFFKDIQKVFFLKEVYFSLDAKNHRYNVSDTIFLKKDGSVSKNAFYRSVRKIFGVVMYSVFVLEEHCSSEPSGIDLDDFKMF